MSTQKDLDHELGIEHVSDVCYLASAVAFWSERFATSTLALDSSRGGGEARTNKNK